MKILITNNRMAKRTGTEMFVFDLARRLMQTGHRPVVYSPHLGKTARQLRELTVPVIDRLDKLGFIPDVIHGHHTYPTLVACARFPQTPAVFVCHSWASNDDAPPKLPTILRYLAVDEACLARLSGEWRVADERLEMLYNFVDLKKFQPRSKLPAEPKRALLFTNRTNFGFYYHKLSMACRKQGIALDRIRSIGGPACESPESKLPEYDLVFARAKSAIEALAVGNAVIVCDRTGIGGMVTTQNFDRLRSLNFGRRSFERLVTVANLVTEIGRYNSDDAAHVSETLRHKSSLLRTIDSLLAVYEEVIHEFDQRPIPVDSLLKSISEHLENAPAQTAHKPNKLKSFFRRSA